PKVSVFVNIPRGKLAAAGLAGDDEKVALGAHGRPPHSHNPAAAKRRPASGPKSDDPALALPLHGSLASLFFGGPGGSVKRARVLLMAFCRKCGRRFST